MVVIDDDLGRSGSGIARKGFERLLVAIGAGGAGAVLAIEASRLARNGRDWHTLLEFCALVGCLLIDESDVYDPRLVNDRLLLGMKGTFSELELSILRQRAHETLGVVICIPAWRWAMCVRRTIGWRWIRTAEYAKQCRGYSASSMRPAASVRSLCGSAMSGSSCRPSPMGRTAESSNGIRLATIRCTGC